MKEHKSMLGGRRVARITNSFSLMAALLAISIPVLTAVPASAQTVVTTVPLGDHPQAVVVNLLTNKIYTVDNSSEVTEIDGVADTPTAIPLGLPPTNSVNAMAVDPITNRIYTTSVDTNQVSVIDGSTHAVAFVPTGVNPVALAVTGPGTESMRQISGVLPS